MFALCSSSTSLFLRGLRSDGGKCPVVDGETFFFVEKCRKKTLNQTKLICLVSRQIRLATILTRFQVYVANVWFVVNIIQVCGHLMR